MLEHVRAWVYSQAWAIEPGKLSEILGVLELRASGFRISDEDIAEVAGASPAADRRAPRRGPVAVLPIMGTITHRASFITEASGFASTQKLSRQFAELAADPEIRAIVLDVDSPGGTVPGVPELAEQIYRARTPDRPIVAVANSLAASAAYWLAASADEIVATPSATVGSIGVFSVHADLSRALDAEGVKYTLISAGKYKTEGNPYEPMGEDAQAAQQAFVDAFYNRFVADVARGRGVEDRAVREGYGEGRVLGANAARSAGLIDRIGTLEATIARYAGAGGVVEAPSRARADLEIRERAARLRRR